jgi:hypothetical protein
MAPGGWCCKRSTRVANKLMFSASTGVSSLLVLGTYALGVLDVCCCCLKLAVCFFFCSSMSAKDAAIAAANSGSSSSSFFGVGAF